jgi:hypothetical protein
MRNANKKTDFFICTRTMQDFRGRKKVKEKVGMIIIGL